MKKGLLLSTLFLLTSCTLGWPFVTTSPTTTSPTSSSDSTTNTTSDPITSEPTTNSTTDSTTLDPTISDTTTSNEDVTSAPTTNTTVPTIEVPYIEGLALSGKMENKTYFEDDQDWNLTGLELIELYSNGEEKNVGSLEALRSDTINYNISIDPIKPALGVTEITIKIENIKEQFITSYKINGITVNEKSKLINFVSPDQYELNDYMPKTYHEFGDNYIYHFSYTPSVGDVNVLVLPIAFKDSTADTQEILDDINTVFNGTEDDTGWESVHTFFDKSSFGNLNLTFTVAPTWYQSNYTKRQGGTFDGLQTASLIEEGVDWYKENYSSTSCQEFDSDKNGHIDCVMAIYSEHNYSVQNSSYSNYWAYCFSRQEMDASLESPTTNMFVFASYDFMYSNNGTGSSLIDLDAHTYIHEFGHALGLDDYYNYNNNASAPAGGFDMQDFNVGDHNSFTKFALGWVKPYVVFGDSEITLKPSSTNENQVIIIPAGGFNEWNSSPFDEYILLEYYTSDGLHYFDSHNNTYPGYPTGSKTGGIRAYHVDARLFEYAIRGDSYVEKGYINNKVSDSSYVTVAANNTNGGDYQTPVSVAQDFKLLHLLSATGRDRFSSFNYLSSNDLFSAGDKFSMSSFGSYFSKTGKMNDGSQLGYEFEIISIDNNGAKIKITEA